MDSTLQERLLLELSNKRINWKTGVHIVNTLRAMLSMWRGERWIKHIWTLIQHKLDQNLYHLKQAYNKRGVVYLMYNTLTKKMVVGSTSANMYQRYAQHIRGRVDNLSRKAANYIINKGVQVWIIIPLEYSNSRTTLYQLEGVWARKLRAYLINNPIELKTRKLTQRPNLLKKERDQDRAEKRRETISTWKKYFHLILHTNVWRQWQPLPLMNLLINAQRHKIRKDVMGNFKYVIRNHLLKQFNIRLKPYYELHIPSSTVHIATQLKSWLYKLILQHNTTPYGRYLATHIKVITKPTLRLRNIVDNHKKTLARYEHEENLAECYCHLYPELQGTNKHVNIRAQDLPDKW